MNDCGSAEIRDQLPDLLHERLDEAARALVIAHLSTCIDCDEELRLLRDVLGMMESRTPRIDLTTIVSALPKPPIAAASIAVTPNAATSNVISIASRRRRWSDWRVAAAVTLLVAGGSSAVLLNRNAPQSRVVATAPAATPSEAAASAGSASTSAGQSVTGTPTVADAAAASTNGSAEASTPGTMAAADDPAVAADLGNGNRLGDLSEQQLQTLLNEIDKLPAVPVTDPDPVSLRVNARPTSFDGT
jgi:hypothetical protein